MPETESTEAEGGQPDRRQGPDSSHPEWWRQVRCILELVEIVAAARDATALAAGTRAVVILGDAIFRPDQ